MPPSRRAAVTASAAGTSPLLGPGLEPQAKGVTPVRGEERRDESPLRVAPEGRRLDHGCRDDVGVLATAKSAVNPPKLDPHTTVQPLPANGRHELLPDPPRLQCA